LGSGIGGATTDPSVIAAKYFIVFLNQIATELLDRVIRLELPQPGVQDRLIAKLANGLELSLNGSEPVASKFNYRQIQDSLAGILRDMNIERLYVVIDEWALIPVEAQPYMAEYLKRSVMAVPQVIAKISAVNYQCQLSTRFNGNVIGMQRGADIPDTIDIDRYLVYDEKTEFVPQFLASVLYNHLGAELKWNLEATEAQKASHINALFTQSRAFVELVRAAEGNCRDMFGVFSKAYFDYFLRDNASKSISIPNIERAATTWYEQEKHAQVQADLNAEETLQYIMNDVLHKYQSRSFLVESAKAEHPRLLTLLNERVLHRLNIIYSHKDRRGVPHDIFTVDYGAYVKYRSTAGKVNEDLDLPADVLTSLVPVNDNRSIRRIIFDPEAVQTQEIQGGLFESCR
jgi:hypothetical protein